MATMLIASSPINLFLKAIQEGEATTGPDKEDWSRMIMRLESGTKTEITSETYNYYLGVLPPHWMGVADNGGCCFAFAEGAQPLRLFWSDRDRYFWNTAKHYCRQLTDKQSREFCKLAGIAQPH